MVVPGERERGVAHIFSGAHNAPSASVRDEVKFQVRSELSD
jgi:hypothetical protein